MAGVKLKQSVVQGSGYRRMSWTAKALGLCTEGSCSVGSNKVRWLCFDASAESGLKGGETEGKDANQMAGSPVPLRQNVGVN